MTFSPVVTKGVSEKETSTPNQQGLFFKPVIQPKLTINQPDDEYEKEADEVADRIMRMPGPSVNEDAFFKPAVSPIQRKCAHCEEEERQQGIQRKESDNSEAVASSLAENYINSLSGGRNLSKNEKSFFEPRMGYDFSNVKVHTETDAARSAQSINAFAYTTGNHIVFNNGQYAPESDSGKKLLAHELTHVVQQNNGLQNSVYPKHIQRAPTIRIVDQNFIGPLAPDQRRAAVSCPIKCNGVTNVGTLHAMGLFYHQSRTGIRNVPNASDNGVGTALHFISSGPKRDCSCDNFKIIQIITTSHPAAGRDGSGYVDNAGRNTPFYGDVYSSGQGEHTISVAGDFRDEGERVSTTHSIYDIPYRSTGGITTNISWQAEACVACVKNAAPDIILGGVTYGFTIPFDSVTNTFGTVQGIGPRCLSVPTSNFVNALRSDPSIPGYDFVPELGVGDFPLPNSETRYA